MFLSEKTMREIHKATLEILETTGVRVYCEEALKLLGSAGCKIVGTLAKIPSLLVEDAIELAPSKFIIYDREGKEALHLGEKRTYYGTADSAPFFDDPFTGERRPFLLDDCRIAVRLIDALPNIDFVSPFGAPQNVPAEVAEIYAFETAVNCTTKPIAFVCPDVENLSAIVEIASAVKDGQESLRKRPFIFALFEPISPLIYTKNVAEKTLWLAEREIPFFISSTVSLGATAPVTLAGALVQSNVEAFPGLVIAQLKRKGAPVGIGACTGVTDMSTGCYTTGAPEHALGVAAYAELARYYDLPSWGNGCQTQSKIPDQQAAIETFMTCLVTSLTGVNVVYDAGYLESGKTSSLEMVVMADEMVGMVRRIFRGIEVNEQTLAKALIQKVGPGGNFLTEQHTLEHFKKELWFPSLMDRQNYEKWSMSGKLTMRDRIAQKIKHLVETHEPKPLPTEVQQSVKEIREKWSC